MAVSPEPAGGQAGNEPTPHRVGGDSTSRRVLEEVLRQTQALYSLESGSDPADLETLLEVARELRGTTFDFDHVMLALVRATLRRQLGPIWRTEEQFNQIVERVARTLYDNPDSQARVQALWERLTAVA